MVVSEKTTVSENTERLDWLTAERLDWLTRQRIVDPEHPAPGQYLTLQEDNQTRLLALNRPVTRIGRGFGADLRLDDQSVSRRHAIITHRANMTKILDDRSSNGTYLNGRRVFEGQLEDGDVIVLGRVVLGYLEIPPPRAK